METNFSHLTFSSVSEVMFRDHEDYVRGINDLVLASMKAEAVILAYSLMSNHVHCCIQMRGNPYGLFRTFRISYGRYFSANYRRKGYICSKDDVSIVEIDGYQHCLTAISYCLRNPLHQGVTSSCLNYAYSSALAYFREGLGIGPFPVTLKVCPRRLAPANFPKPASLRFEEDGRASLDTSVDYKQVEMLFQTHNEFIYNMVIRRSGKKWREQQSLEPGSPVTLELLESHHYMVEELEKNERRNMKVSDTSDIFLCEVIDNELLPMYDVKSVYQLSMHQQLSIGHCLSAKYSSSLTQIGRCLAVTDNDFYRLFYVRH